MRRPVALVALALSVALVVLPMGALAAEFSTQERSYVAQSTWGIKYNIGLSKLWLLERPLWVEKVTGEGVRVAVIDTGIDPSHPDLQGVLDGGAWKDFTGDKNGRFHKEPYDDHGHGTHVAGIIAARGHFQPNPLRYYWIFGDRGVAPETTLLVAKAMNSQGTGDDATVAEAILWAMDPNGDGDLSDGADLINLSIGIEKGASPKGSRGADGYVGVETRRAVMKAIKAGVVVVVSSGNDGKNTVSEPGSIPQVITVGAVDQDGSPADFSNHGRSLDLLAPGVLVSTFPKGLDTFDFSEDGYVGMAGTSMAAPVVTGVVALMMHADPSLREKSLERDLTKKVTLIEDVLKRTADPVTGSTPEKSGSGIVNAHAAVSAVDRGEGELHWGMITLLGLIGAGVLFLFLRPALKRRREAAGEPTEGGH